MISTHPPAAPALKLSCPLRAHACPQLPSRQHTAPAPWVERTHTLSGSHTAPPDLSTPGARPLVASRPPAPTVSTHTLPTVDIPCPPHCAPQVHYYRQRFVPGCVPSPSSTPSGPANVVCCGSVGAGPLVGYTHALSQAEQLFRSAFPDLPWIGGAGGGGGGGAGGAPQGVQRGRGWAARQLWEGGGGSDGGSDVGEQGKCSAIGGVAPCVERVQEGLAP